MTAYILSLPLEGAAQQYLVKVIKSGSGTGNVVASDGAINCGSVCEASYFRGASYQLTATADPGSIFSGWKQWPSCPENTCGGVIFSGATYEAVFSSGEVVLTVNRSGFVASGQVTSAGGEIDCGSGSICRNAFPRGAVVMLTATPNTFSVFAGWSGGGASCTGSGSCAVTLDTDMIVTANFRLKTYDVSVVKVGTGRGRVFTQDQVIDCGIKCSQDQYTILVPPILNAQPIGASVFSGWSGGGCTGTGTCGPPVNVNSVITATFDAVPASAPPAPKFEYTRAGSQRVLVSFLPPANDNGAPITRYDVACDNGATVSSGPHAPIVVKGLTNEIPYTCTVVAVNALGSSPPSQAFAALPSLGATLFSFSIAKQMTHASSGPLDILLDGFYATVEPRANPGFHEVVIELSRPLTSASVQILSMTPGPGTNPLPDSFVDFADATARIKFFGVPDGVRLSFRLIVNGDQIIGEYAFRTLLGDVTQSRTVTAADIAAVKARRGQLVNSSNAVFDLDRSGSIDDADVAIVKARSGMQAP